MRVGLFYCLFIATNTMTTYKPISNAYDPHKNDLTAFVSIGVSLVTPEVHHIIQDGRHVEIPADDAICYTTVPREIVHTGNGGADWDAIALLVEQEGYFRKHYKIVSVWECTPDHIADEIF